MLDPRDQHILHQLADGAWHSGTGLAAASKLSRAALAKRMQHLRSPPLALPIESRHGRGYRIAAGLDLLTRAPAEAKPALAEQADLAIVSVCDSTNSVLAREPTLNCVLAEYQTAGRGRQARVWTAPYAQNLLLSLRHRYPRWPDHVAALSLVLGLSVVQALREWQIPATIKWPNDIWLHGRKLGGLLVETRGEALSGCELIVGLGLNVHMQQADPIDQAWTSLKREGWVGQRADLARHCLLALQRCLQRFPDTPLAAQLEPFAALDALAAAAVSIVDGTQILHGRSLGLSAQGALRLELESGEVRECLVGDVSLRRRSTTGPD